MKRKNVFFWALLFGAGLLLGSCCNRSRQEICAVAESGTAAPVVLKDYGGQPTVLNIEDYTLGNENFRVAIWTGNGLQVTLMTVPVGCDVGLECHEHIDQFLRIEQGNARVEIGTTEQATEFVESAGADSAIFVPAGRWHNIINVGEVPLKLYSIYAPVEHPFGTVHKTQQEAVEAEAHHGH